MKFSFKKIYTYIKYYLYAICAFVGSLALIININKDTEFVYSFKNDTCSFVIIFIAIFFLYFKTSNIAKNIEKRGKIVAIILSVIYALIDIIGYTYNNYKESIFEVNYLIKVSIRFLGLIIIFNRVIKVLLYYIQNRDSNNSCDNDNKPRKSRKIYNLWCKKCWLRILVVAVIISICYLPYLLYYYPGSIFYDGEWQMLYVNGTIELSNHHPVFSTMIVALFMKMADFFGGDNNLAVTLYCSAQMVINAFVFSYFIEYLRKIGISRKVRVLAFIILTFLPVFPLNAITLKKDISFALAFFLFSLFLVRILYEKDFFNKKRNIVFFVIITICTCLLRNNGLYVIAISAPFILFSFRKYLKYLLISFGVVFVFCTGWNYYIHNVMKVIPSAPKEMLAIPAQAFARVIKYNKAELDKKDKHLIYVFIPRNDLKKLYDPAKSDPVRFKMDDEAISKDFGGFVSLYFRLLFQFPKTVIDAFFNLNYGYFYPDYKAWRIDYGINKVKSTDLPFEYPLYEKLGLKENRLIEFPFIKDLSWLCNYGEQMPFVNIFYSIGLWFEIVLFLVGYNYYNHKSFKNVIILPILLLWFTCLASPINGEYRYIYSMFITMPVYFLLVLKDERNL
ncbi:MAG: hypothetical protein IKI57_02595 [Clostridia bacterium]|nr:hypothetical protein [Clostridia bacterium]